MAVAQNVGVFLTNASKCSDVLFKKRSNRKNDDDD
jgi:hypothetical protein